MYSALFCLRPVLDLNCELTRDGEINLDLLQYLEIDNQSTPTAFAVEQHKFDKRIRASMEGVEREGKETPEEDASAWPFRTSEV